MAIIPPLRMFLKSLRVRFLDDAAAGRKDDVQIFAPRFLVGLLALDADGRGNLFFTAEFEKIGDGTAFARAEPSGNLEDSLDVAAAALGEEHQVIVGRGGEEMLHEIAVFVGLPFAGGHSDDPFAAAPLRPIRADQGALDESVVREGDDDALVGDEILDGDLAFRGYDLRAPLSCHISLNVARAHP